MKNLCLSLLALGLAFGSFSFGQAADAHCHHRHWRRWAYGTPPVVNPYYGNPAPMVYGQNVHWFRGY